MRYLGMGVHAKSTVWCLLDAQGEVIDQGRVETSAPALGALVRALSTTEEVVAGQEVGTMTYLVHDTVTAAGASMLSFNAHQLRMIAASRKKTDRRDAYWIAKAVQSGMYPHPVYIPTGEIRELRALLHRWRLLKAEHNRWPPCAAYLRAAGCRAARGAAALRTALRGEGQPATGSRCAAPGRHAGALPAAGDGEFVQIRRTRRGTISRDGYVKVLTRDRRKGWVRAGVLTKYCARPLRADPDSDVQPTESEERWDRSASAFVTLAAVCPNSIRRASSSSGAGKIERTMRVFALRAYQPPARRVYQPAAALP